MDERRTFATRELIDAGVLEIGDGYRAKNSEMADAGVPFIRAGDVAGRVNTVGTDLLNAVSAVKAGRKRSLPGDVVITTKGTIGRLAFVREGDPVFIYSPQLCYWRSLDLNIIDPRWLFFAMQSTEMCNQISWSAGQTDMAPYVSLTDQRDAFKLTLPPIGEQQEIAATLGALDDKIELNRKTVATLEEMARALYRSWFVDFDPVRARAEGRTPAHMDAATAALFPDKFGEDGLPMGWKERGLSEVAEFLNGAALQKYPAVNDELSLPVIKIAELRSGVTATSGKASIKVPEKYKVKDGDVLFSWSGSLLQKVWVDGPGALNQHLFKVTSSFVPQWFHFFAVDFHMDEFRIIAASKATTMGHIQRHHLAEAKIALPSNIILSAADKVLRPLFDAAVQQQLENRTLVALRDTLLPRLMSGELRVGAARELVEEVA